MDGVIKAHCMGMEFPRRDTDGPNVKWVMPSMDPCLVEKYKRDYDNRANQPIDCDLTEFIHAWAMALPSAADLDAYVDAVAEEQRVKEKTSAQVPNR